MSRTFLTLFSTASVLTAALLFEPSTEAQELQGERRYEPTDEIPEPEEMRMLPSYCRVHPFVLSQFGEDLTKDTPERKRWEEYFKEDFIHLHHYCWGLNWINRAYRSRVEEYRQEYLQAATADLEYITKNVSPTLPLLAEVYVRKGLALTNLGRSHDALDDFLRALHIDPRYVPAYGALSNYYLDAQNKEEAHRIIERGLRQVPDSAFLQNRLAELQEVER